MKEWLSIKEAAYVVNRDKSRLYRWIDKGWLAWRKDNDGLLEVASADVLRVEAVTQRGRPRRNPRDTPNVSSAM